MKHSKIEALALGFALTLVGACGEPANADTSSSSAAEGEAGEGESGTEGTTTEGTTDGGGCDGTHEPNADGTADGETCTEDGDCASNFCLSFADAPVDPGAVCAPAAGNCTTRAAGTVRDFVTQAPVAGLTIKVAGAIAASVNPTNAMGLAEGVTDASGQFDITSDDRINQPLGVVGIVSGTDYHLSATGLQSPSIMNFYPPGTGIHDVWTVALSTLTGWNASLAADAALMDYLPLGEKGGVVGMVRNGTTGVPTAGHTVGSKGASSAALVRYLNEAGDAFDGTATGSSGIFILVNPGLGEEFQAELGGTPVDGADGTAGSTSNSLFILILDL